MAAGSAEELTLSIHVPSFVTSALSHLPSYLVGLWQEHPVHLAVEVLLVLLILFILLKRPAKKKSKLESLPASVAQELINDYEPEPLCPELNPVARQVLDDVVVLEEKPAKYTKVRGSPERLLNLATMDFLGFGQRAEVLKAASDALDKYGCGSCGPRGFYGSIDVHVYLEQHLAKFFGTEEAIVYSDASSTATSAIPAFSNRADLLVVDDGVNDSVLTGVNLSRSRVFFFKHNDMADLERILVKVAEEDKRLRRTPQRRFIVVEGLYRNFGDIAPLDEVVALKRKYKWRLFLDESHSIGVFGASGRGVAEHFGVPSSDVELLISSLSTTLASVGGFCVGTREVVEHQRLSGAGYCFSASSPPFVSTAASASVALLEAEAKATLMPTIRHNAEFFHKQLASLTGAYLVSKSNPASGLVHVRLMPKFRCAADRAGYDEPARFAEDAKLRKMSREMRAKGFLVTVASYIVSPAAQTKQTIGSAKRPALPPPSLRLVVTALQTEDELSAVAKALLETATSVLEAEAAAIGTGAGDASNANAGAGADAGVDATASSLRQRKY